MCMQSVDQNIVFYAKSDNGLRARKERVSLKYWLHLFIY